MHIGRVLLMPPVFGAPHQELHPDVEEHRIPRVPVPDPRCTGEDKFQDLNEADAFVPGLDLGEVKVSGWCEV